VIRITIQQKIDMALAYSGSITKKDIADKLGVTPSAFGQRLKTGKFTQQELETIAAILGCKYFSGFEFPDGLTIK
jgi:predicted ArsR family transcriptional regulator